MSVEHYWELGLMTEKFNIVLEALFYPNHGDISLCIWNCIILQIWESWQFYGKVK